MNSTKLARTAMISAIAAFAVALSAFVYSLVRLYDAGLKADLDPGGEADWLGWALLLGGVAVGVVSGIVALATRRTGTAPPPSSSL